MKSKSTLGLSTLTATQRSIRNNLILRLSKMGKLGNIWKTMLAGGAGVAALAALNATIKRHAGDPDDSALGGEAHFFPWKHGRVFYKVSGLKNAGAPLVFIHGVGAG